MKNTIPSPVLCNLIHLGSSSEGEFAGVLERLVPHDAVNRFHWRAWDVATEGLCESDHECLARGLVIAEEQLRWSGGSVAGSIWAYRSFAQKFPASADRLADWMLANSNNPWVPFGSMRGNVRSLEEYRAYLKSETQRRKSAEENSKPEKYLAEARKATTQRLAKMREAISRAESSARAALFKELKSLPVEDRLVHIALDDEHELLFYSPELLDGLPDSLSAEAAWALEKMLARAAEIRTGPWRAWINQTNNKQKEEISHGGSV
jgi:hypothetical protein